MLIFLVIFCIVRYIEPLPPGSPTKFEFENLIIGQVIPSGFIPAIEKGFKEAANSWVLCPLVTSDLWYWLCYLLKDVAFSTFYAYIGGLSALNNLVVCFFHDRGSLIGHPVENICVCLTDGAAHAVDSSELAFKLASIYAFRKVILVSFLCKLF